MTAYHTFTNRFDTTMEQLIIFLGKGPSTDKVQAGTYRQATYFMKDGPTEEIETPFVGEALARLHPGRFDAIHILGTAGSMWGVLLEHFGHALQDDALIEEVLSLREADPDVLPSRIASAVTTSVGTALDTNVYPHLIPVGKSNEDYWQMLKQLTALNITSGTVSIDVTHSLRSHPIFLLLALVYFRALHTDLRLGSVFYGALVLTQDYFDGRTPIFDLRPMVKLLDWIEAASAFDRYGDASPIATLIEQEDGDFDDLAKRARYVSQVLQLNTLSDIQANTSKMISYLDRSATDQSPLLEIIKPQLSALPKQLQDIPKWQAMLTVARQHWDSYRAGLAVLALWEAIIERLSDVYGVSRDQERSTYSELSKRACGHGCTRWYNSKGLKHFPDKADQLRKYRNGIAHPRDQEYQPPEVYSNFPDILDYFEEHLGADVLHELPRAKSLT